MKKLVAPGDNDFNVILYQIDFTNLKLALKSVIREKTQEDLFLSNGNVDHKFLIECIKEQNFEKLPEFLKFSTKNAFEVLLKSNDANLSDGMIDKEMLDEFLKIAKKADNDFIKKYIELFVAFSNIKTALRGCKFKKSKRFFDVSLAECKSLNIELLRKSACEDLDSLKEYLLQTEYNGLFETTDLNDYSRFLDKWFDDKIMLLCKNQKSNPFTIAPIISYILAREIEFKNVKIIYMGKKLKANEIEIKERLRQMYA